MTNDIETPTVAEAFGRNDLLPEESLAGITPCAWLSPNGLSVSMSKVFGGKSLITLSDANAAIAAAYEQGKRDAVPEWMPIETAPKNGLSRLYLIKGLCVQGFVDATGSLMVQTEISPHWRIARGKPTHWMPLPALPSNAL